jgi:hypothetical protein
MNSINLVLKDSNSLPHDININTKSESSKLLINDDIISQYCEESNIEEIVEITLTLGVSNMAIIIDNYTLTDTICVESFYDIKSHISIFQTKNTNIILRGQTIETLQADCKNVMLEECNIDKLQIGLFSMMNPENSLKMDEIDLQAVTIKKIDIYTECKKINVQRSNISELNITHYIQENDTSTVSNLHIWQNTNFEKISIMNTVKEFMIEDSNIHRLFAYDNLFIHDLILKDSTIENCFRFQKHHFENSTYDSWQWIEKSANNARDLKERAEANYQMAKALYSTETKIDKLLSKLFDFCAGYGYKPLRVVRTSGILVLLNTTFFTIINALNDSEINSLSSFVHSAPSIFGESFLISLATLAGQNEFQTDGNILLNLLSITEYLIGVILFAVFVNALYARYKE